LHFSLVNSWSRQVHSGLSPSTKTVYLCSFVVCDGTSHRLLLPLRASFVLAAISKPLISLASISLDSIASLPFVGRRLTMDLPKASVSNRVWFSKEARWLAPSGLVSIPRLYVRGYV